MCRRTQLSVTNPYASGVAICWFERSCMAQSPAPSDFGVRDVERDRGRLHTRSGRNRLFGVGQRHRQLAELGDEFTCPECSTRVLLEVAPDVSELALAA